MGQDYIKLLKKVGVETFVRYYYDLKNNKNERRNNNIYSAFSKNKEKWSIGSTRTKASKGKKIFLIQKEKEALEYIINESTKLSYDVIQKAKEIYRKEFLI